MNKILIIFMALLSILFSACSSESTPTTTSQNVSTNTLLIANAGVDRSVATTQSVNLDASSSFDSDGDTLSYSWSIITQPIGSSPILSNASTKSPVFTPDIDGIYIISLIVKDTTSSSIADTLRITSINTTPLADAGSNISMSTGESTRLDGTNSYDGNGNTLTYVWSVVRKPSLSSPIFLNTTTPNPDFTPDKDGKYIISLTVNDGLIDSISDSISIVVTTIVSGITPIFTSQANITVNENQTGVIEVTTTQVSTYTLSGVDSESFKIDVNSGVILFNNAPDYETKKEYSIIVTAKNGDKEAQQTITIYINDLNENIINLCDTKSLEFDKLINSTTILNTWVEGSNTLLNNTTVNWDAIKNADHYEFDLKFPSGWIPGYINAYSGTNIRFDYDSSVSGYSLSALGEDVVLTSDEFISGANLTISIRAVDSNGNTISTSSALSFMIARDYISETTSKLSSEIDDNSVNLEWCAVNTADTYTVKYGALESNLNTTIENINSSTLTQVISSLINEKSYFFSLASANENGNGKFSDTIKATPSIKANTLDFSIEKVVFNQSVQVDLENNTDTIPLIANKSGVLRVFINADTLNQNKKVMVELGGSNNGTALSSIIKEVLVSDSTFLNADSTNKVVFFDINDTAWMQEGTSFFIKIDPFNTIKELDETNNRYPVLNEQAFGYEDRYKMQINLVPVLTSEGSVTITQEIVDELSKYLQAIYPLSEVEVSVDKQLNLSQMTAKENGDGWDEILGEVDIYKDTEVSKDSTKADIFYYGVLDREGSSETGLSGLAYINNIDNFSNAGYSPTLVGIGRLDTVNRASFYETVAHEIGHNHGREHVDNTDETNDLCGAPNNVDSSYPYNSSGLTYGRIARTGYDSSKRNLLEKSLYHDLMSYCSRTWISDYTYKGISEFQKKLDILYSRSTTTNARIISTAQVKVLGTMIKGKVEVDSENIPQYKVTRQYEILWNENDLLTDSNYYALVTMKDTIEYKIAVNVEALDHSNTQHFKFFIPSVGEIDSIVIKSIE